MNLSVMPTGGVSNDASHMTTINTQHQTGPIPAAVMATIVVRNGVVNIMQAICSSRLGGPQQRHQPRLSSCA